MVIEQWDVIMLNLMKFVPSSTLKELFTTHQMRDLKHVLRFIIISFLINFFTERWCGE